MQRNLGKNRGAEKPVSIRTKYYVNYNAQSTNAHFAAVSLAPNTAGMGANSSQIAAFVDMYRMARIDKIRIQVSANGGNAAISAGWILYYSKYGAAAPAGWTDCEGVDISSVAFIPNSGVMPTQLGRATLKIPGPNISVVDSAAGPGLPRWISTQSDGVQTSFGSIYVVFSGTSANTAFFLVEVDVSMSFYQMMDPATISAVWKRQLTPSTDALPAPKRTSSPDAEVTESQLLLDRLLKKYPKST